jgi:outer membrane protein TolC
MLHPVPFLRRIWVLVLAVAQGLAMPASAQPLSPPAQRPVASEHSGTPVTFDQALGLAESSPAVFAAQSAIEEQGHLAGAVSSMVANPTVTVQPGAALDPLDNRWKYVGEATVLQSWNLAGLPGNRRSALKAEGKLLVAEARAAALSHRLVAAQAWMELWAAQRSLADALQEAELAREFSVRMAKAAAAAAFTRAEAADAETYAAEAHVQAIAAQGEVIDRGFQLAAAMGRADEKPLMAAGPLPEPPTPARSDWAVLLEAAGKLPGVTAHALASDTARARAVELRSARSWLLGTGVKGTRDYLGTWGVQAVVEVTVPLFDRGEREAAPQAAAAARSLGDHQEALAIAATELTRALHEVEHSGEVLAAVEKELLPAAVEGARVREASMRAGETTVLEVLVARRIWAAARARRTRALAAHAWAQVKLSMLLAHLGLDGAP